ncbi:MAG: hypothetical protein Q8M88_14425 [Phenylobacterium sp.]|uniref:hypothetical protein n=1 Tax=Phenylobacterium sp. TaxID=1871053 RepID=UPI00273731BD|nr:hypothetical protein [Phenylobacterium sp.]MDP3175625.1 hypothetical protein [Phenylobacterium sp.]MDP3522640.1 hypothetical protein [Hydrogenophaga sp.]
MRRFTLPHRLYEALPALYAIAGLLTLFNLPNTLGWLSGLLLIGAGWQVWRMRYAYRSQRSRQRRSVRSPHHRPRTHGSDWHVRPQRF